MSNIISLKPTFTFERSVAQISRLELVQADDQKNIVFDFNKGIKPILTREQSLETASLLQNRVKELKCEANWKTFKATLLQIISAVFTISPWVSFIGGFVLMCSGLGFSLAMVGLCMAFMGTMILLLLSLLAISMFYKANQMHASANSLREQAHSLSYKIPFFQNIPLEA
jgi:ABC-type multidrug transport system fused ATPase/permease subunit